MEAASPDTPLFSLDGRTFRVKVLDVYDADTVTVAMELDGRISAFKVRLLGIDTPEMRPSLNKPNREVEKRLALRARNTLVGWVTDHSPDPDVKYSRKRLRELFFNHNRRTLWLRAGGFDKYGRLLGELLDSSGGGGSVGLSINERLVSEGYARAYDGTGPRGVW